MNGNRSRMYSDLSPARRSLVNAMSSLGFGRIEGVTVTGREPCTESVGQVVEDVKIGLPKAIRRGDADFELKGQVQHLFSIFDSLVDGYLDRIEVRDGLPVHVAILHKGVDLDSLPRKVSRTAR